MSPPEPWTTSVHAARWAVPPCQTYVLHLAYDPFMSKILCSSMTIILPPGIERITLVMAPTTFDGPTGSPPPNRPLGMLRTLLWGFIHYVPEAELQVVGVENMHPSSLGYPAGSERLPSPEEVVARVQEMVNSLVDGMPNDRASERGLCLGSAAEASPSGPIPGALGRISLPTFEEWEASLPSRQRTILAHPPEYGL